MTSDSSTDGIAPLSSIRSSTTILTTVAVVAPTRTWVAWVVKLWLVSATAGLPNGASPLARNSSSTASPPLPFC
jgi:hypothetical protein